MRGQLSCAVLLVTCQILLPLVSSDSFHQGGGKAGQQGEWVQCGPITSRKHYEKFVQPPPFTGLNKAIFFSKMGKSTLCEKLAKEYEGELDFAVVSGTPATWATEHLGVDQYPALMLVRYGSKHTLKYGGRFKFGAFAKISEWLDESIEAIKEGADTLAGSDDNAVVGEPEENPLDSDEGSVSERVTKFYELYLPAKVPSLKKIFFRYKSTGGEKKLLADLKSKYGGKTRSQIQTEQQEAQREARTLEESRRQAKRDDADEESAYDGDDETDEVDVAEDEIDASDEELHTDDVDESDEPSSPSDFPESNLPIDTLKALCINNGLSAKLTPLQATWGKQELVRRLLDAGVPKDELGLPLEPGSAEEKIAKLKQQLSKEALKILLSLESKMSAANFLRAAQVMAANTNFRKGAGLDSELGELNKKLDL